MAKKKARRRAKPKAPNILIQGELGKAVAEIEKRSGAGAIRVASQVKEHIHLSTGAFTLDYGLLGGVPEGTGTMIYGDTSTGKTTQIYLTIAGHQRKYAGMPNEVCMLVDLERKFKPAWAQRLGVNVDKLLINEPPFAEAGVDAVQLAMNSEECGLVALDSLAAMLPKIVKEKSAEDNDVGTRAKLIGNLCSKVQQSWIDMGRRDLTPTFLCTNQWREKIGVFFGDPRTLPGGKYQNFLANTKWETKCKEIFPSKKKDTADGELRHLANEFTFKFPKTKHGFSIREGVFQMVMDNPDHPHGLTTGWIDDALTVITVAKREGMVTGGGSSWRIADVDGKFRNQNEMCGYLYQTPEVFTRVKQALIVKKRQEQGMLPVPPDNYLLEWL